MKIKDVEISDDDPEKMLKVLSLLLGITRDEQKEIISQFSFSQRKELCELYEKNNPANLF